MQLTIEHSQSSYGMPIFVANNGQPLDYADGIRAVRRQFDWSVSDMADQLGVSPRTVENWEQGRMPQKTALLLLKKILDGS